MKKILIAIVLIGCGIGSVATHAQDISDHQAMNSGTVATVNIPFLSDAQGTVNEGAHYLDPETDLATAIGAR